MACGGGENDSNDNLLCPICFTLPQNEVYQCRDGHVLCKSCYLQVSNCPQCRLKLDLRNPIRCRFLEGLLDGILTIDCSFKPNGCDKKLTRSLIREHQKKCRFNFKKFGPLVNICKLFGYPDCEFHFNSGNTEEAIKHFVTSHGCVLTSSCEFEMELSSFQETITSNPLNENHFWTPIIVDFPDKHCFLMIFVLFNKRTGSLIFSSIILPFSSASSNSQDKLFQASLQVEYSVLDYVQGGSLKWSFIQVPVPFSATEKDLLEDLSSPFDNFGLLALFIKDGSLFLKCCAKEISKDNEKTGKTLERFTCLKTNSCSLPLIKRWNRNSGSVAAMRFLEHQEKECKVKPESLMPFIQKIFNENNGQHLEEILGMEDVQWLRDGLLFLVARHGSVEAIKYLAERMDINKVDVNGDSPLHHCLEGTTKYTLEKVKVLVEKGADIQHLNDDKRSPLHYAAWFSNVNVVEHLLDNCNASVGVNLRDKMGWTPLHYATLERDEELALKLGQVMINHGADLTISNNVGKTPLDVVAQTKYKNKLKTMLRMY